MDPSFFFFFDGCFVRRRACGCLDLMLITIKKKGFRVASKTPSLANKETIKKRYSPVVLSGM